MVGAISPINVNSFSSHNDAEYLRILQELRALGIAPSGNKSTDKAKLEQAKLELIQKIETKQNEEQKQTLQVQPLEPAQDTERAKMEDERLGAMTVAELNKLYFGL